jgi:PmbA protein
MEEIINYLKTELMKKGMDDVIVQFYETEGRQLKFVNNKIVKTGSELTSNIGIFAAKDKRIISTSLKDINKEKADELIRKIASMSNHIPQNEDYHGIAQGPFKYNVKFDYDKKVMDIDESDIIEKAINKALENSKRVAGIFEIWHLKSHLVTSGEAEVKENSSNLYFSIRAFNEKDESGHMTCCSNTLKKFEIEKTSERAAEIATLAKKPVEAKSGRFPVIFSQMAFAPLLNNTSEAASIYNVESGFSFLNELNKKYGDFNLQDDATLPTGFNSTSFDDEGVPTKKTDIFDKGILKSYLHNTSTAKKYMTETTANAGLIAPRSFNILFDCKKGDVFDVKEGIYITNVWYTRFQNYANGDFSTIPRDGAFLIKNGEIVQSLKGLRISDNMLNILKNIKYSNKKVIQIKSWEAEIPTFTPEVLVNNVNITKPTH